MISFMSDDEKQAILSEDYESDQYQLANEHYMQLHCAGPFDEDTPECVKREKKAGTRAYLIGWGPNEYTPLGTLKDFEYTNRLNEIQVPALIISGTNDLCTPLVAKTMYDGIKNAKWHLMPECRHMCFVDDHDTYCHNLEDWLASVD